VVLDSQEDEEKDIAGSILLKQAACDERQLYVPFLLPQS
jgi:hypothetical protein